MKRSGYLMIREAAVQYRVSRAKLHRLINAGHLTPAKDPRDDRITLLRADELEELFRFPAKEDESMRHESGVPYEVGPAGRLTPEGRTKVDTIRRRISEGRPSPYNSVDIIREEREKRDRELFEAVYGDGEETEASGRDR